MAAIQNNKRDVPADRKSHNENHQWDVRKAHQQVCSTTRWKARCNTHHSLSDSSLF